MDEMTLTMVRIAVPSIIGLVGYVKRRSLVKSAISLMIGRDSSPYDGKTYNEIRDEISAKIETICNEKGE